MISSERWEKDGIVIVRFDLLTGVHTLATYLVWVVKEIGELKRIRPSH
jgi:hypothetical protein